MRTNLTKIPLMFWMFDWSRTCSHPFNRLCYASRTCSPSYMMVLLSTQRDQSWGYLPQVENNSFETRPDYNIQTCLTLMIDNLNYPANAKKRHHYHKRLEFATLQWVWQQSFKNIHPTNMNKFISPNWLHWTAFQGQKLESNSLGLTATSAW